MATILLAQYKNSEPACQAANATVDTKRPARPRNTIIPLLPRHEKLRVMQVVNMTCTTGPGEF